jgi:hypothetical protein
MTTIIDMLTEKNQCLEKFFRLNEAELENFSAGDFDNIEAFYATREGLLAIIKKIDDMIEKSNDIPQESEQIEPQIKKAILESLQYKNDLVNRILEQDLRILSAIESAKSTIIRELTQVRSAKKAIGSYKSGQKNQRLDEEA